MKERLAVVFTGGKAAGWPAGIKGVTDAAEEQGFEVAGIEDGCEGLFVPNARFKDIHEYGDPNKWMYSTGSPIYASRYTPFDKKKREGETDKMRDARALAEFNGSDLKQTVIDNMTGNRIRALILFGGDDSIWTLSMLMRAGALEGNIATKTIDNDVLETLSHGHITAGAYGRREVNKIRIEARTYSQVAIIEAMGRHAGHLAQQHHNADIILPAQDFPAKEYPRLEITREQLIRRITEVFQKRGLKERGDAKKGNAVVVVPEGFPIDGQEIFIPSRIEDDHGHKRLGGVGNIIQDWIESAGFGTKYQRPGYDYRTPRPTKKDAKLTYAFGRRSAEEAIRGNTGIAAIARGDNLEIGIIDLNETGGGKFMRPEDYNFDALKPRTKALRAE